MGIRRKLGLAVAMTATVAVPLLWALPATADADAKCSGGWICLYENEDFNRGKGAEGDHWRNFKESKSNRPFCGRPRGGLGHAGMERPHA